MPIDGKPVKGRGAEEQVRNRFLRQQYGVVHWEGIDVPDDPHQVTRFIETFPKTIVNQVRSPDLPFARSMNPYQGCEHGCSYCYARPTHEYWGYSAGLDFEQIVLVKRNAPELLVRTLQAPSWRPEPIMIAGATDPYQPVERKEGLTRKLLQVLSAHRHPAGVITKNALILRDVDLLGEMAELGLVSVAISLTTMNEDLRRKMEPRTSTTVQRLRAIRTLADAGIPVRAMIAPVIPALNDKEIPALLEAAAEAGARAAGYTVLRVNGAVKDVFVRWLRTHLPDRAAKVIAQTSMAHGGSLADARSGRRMRGEGAFAENIADVFRIFSQRYFQRRFMPELDRSRFQRPTGGQLDLFN
ncbi:MAG: PA0069 family radical SAM protein [Flavobacteriales bacterium]|nr:PA0069 family radical SAM protein [Flavobacteriales bacterium]MCB9167968.1 PA0069 family radical SAM protein [Flavobacteriales bacterium]